MSLDDLFTAPQVAKICSTDLKTIHNWVNRGEIKYFRTPGRHLRFRRQDIVEFLEKFGYPVPEGFNIARAHVVVLDENKDFNEGLQQMLSSDMDVDGYTDNLDAMFAIGNKRPSLVLINGESQENRRVVEHLASPASKERVPVAVYGFANFENDIIAECFQNSDPVMIRQKVVDMLGIRA